MASFLEAKQVTKYFGKLCAVNNVDYSLEKGKTVGIIGPNGSGKTTFFHLLSGFYLPTNGDIHLGGRQITNTDSYNRTGMGLARTFQLVSVFESLSVWE